MENLYKHYIRLDKDKNIVHGFSDAFDQQQDGDRCINENGERHFELFGQPNPLLRNMQGVYLYRYIDNTVVPKTQGDIEEETPAPPPPQPTSNERIAAMEAAIREMAGVIYG